MRHSLRLQMHGRTFYRNAKWRLLAVVFICVLTVVYSSHFSEAVAAHLTLDFASILLFYTGSILLFLSYKHETQLCELSSNIDGESLKSPQGVYSIVRSPRELAMIILLISISTLSASWIVIVASVLFMIPIFERVSLHRENILVQKFGDRYLNYVARVPLVVPRFEMYRAAHSPQPLGRAAGLTADILLPVSVLLVATESIMKFAVAGSLPDELGSQWQILLASTILLFFITRRR